MFLKRLLCFGALASLLLSTGCEASFQASTARLSEPKLASEVDAKTLRPTKMLDKVTPKTGTIYATAKFSAAPPGTKVKMVFYFLDGGKRQIASDEVSVQGAAWVNLRVSPPHSGWPQGKYEVEFLLNGKPAEKINFTVDPDGAASPASKSPATAPPAAGSQAPAKPAGEQVKWMGDDKYGFAFRAPADWRQRETKKGDYLVNGPAGSPSDGVVIIIQMIAKAPGSASLMVEMKNLLQQFDKLPSGKLLKKGEFAVAGQQSPFFIITYQAKGPGGKMMEYAHTQLGLERKKFILLISYAADPAIYKKYLPVFQRMMDTLKFREKE